MQNEDEYEVLLSVKFCVFMLKTNKNLPMESEKSTFFPLNYSEIILTLLADTCFKDELT